MLGAPLTLMSWREDEDLGCGRAAARAGQDRAGQGTRAKERNGHCLPSSYFFFFFFALLLHHQARGSPGPPWTLYTIIFQPHSSVGRQVGTEPNVTYR